MAAGRGAGKNALLGLAVALLALPSLPAVAAPKKPPAPAPRKPTAQPAASESVTPPPPAAPSASAPPAAPPPAEGASSAASPVTVEVALCPADATLQTTGEALVELLRRDCRPVRTEDGPLELTQASLVVAICIRGSAAVAPKECSLHASLDAERGAQGSELALSPDGELAISLKGSRVAAQYSPTNGTRLALTVTSERTSGAVSTTRTPMLWRKAVQAYGGGAYIWFPILMVTTDFSQNAAGYRFGISPIALAFGTRFYPSASSRGYFGASLFAAWNLLIPNSTQTLSDTTDVRLNYKGLGGGLLLDAAGFIGVGAGVGHTFTSDARTDFRMWLYFGPRLFGFTNDF